MHSLHHPSPPATLPPPKLRHVSLSASRTTLSDPTPTTLALSTTINKTKQLHPAPTTSPVADVGDSASAAYWDYQFLFLSQRTETQEPIPLRPVYGAIPSDFPLGAYYLAGPGLFTDDHGSTVHPLDGHGYLRAFQFVATDHDHGGVGVTYSAKYVRTEALQEESRTASWRFTHRGPFSVLSAGKKLGNTKVMKNVANTSVLRWGGRMMCLWEGGDPHEVDEETLETIGTVHLAGGGGDRTVEERRRKQLPEMVRDGAIDVAAVLLKPILHRELFFN